MGVIYKYMCLECGYTFDEPPGPESGELACPHCGGAKVKRQKCLYGGVSTEDIAEDEYSDALLQL